MAATAFLFSKFFNLLTAKDTDLDADTFKVMLTTNSYTPDQDTHEFKSDVTNEVPGTGGYTTGGSALAGVTFGYTAGTNTFKFDADDVTWAGVTIAATRRAVIYDNSSGGTDASRRLVGWIDFGADQAPAGIDFVLLWNAAGIWNLVVA